MLIKSNPLSWLPNSLTKGLKNVPEIVWEPESTEYAGYYMHGEEYIVVTESEGFESTIVHEFRHYTQYNNGLLPDSGSKLDFSIPYENMIVKYFTTYWHELDALIFEYKYTKNEINEWWLKSLVGECNGL